MYKDEIYKRIRTDDVLCKKIADTIKIKMQSVIANTYNKAKSLEVVAVANVIAEHLEVKVDELF